MGPFGLADHHGAAGGSTGISAATHYRQWFMAVVYGVGVTSGRFHGKHISEMTAEITRDGAWRDCS